MLGETANNNGENNGGKGDTAAGSASMEAKQRLALLDDEIFMVKQTIQITRNCFAVDKDQEGNHCVLGPLGQKLESMEATRRECLKLVQQNKPPGERWAQLQKVQGQQEERIRKAKVRVADIVGRKKKLDLELEEAQAALARHEGKAAVTKQEMAALTVQMANGLGHGQPTAEQPAASRMAEGQHQVQPPAMELADQLEKRLEVEIACGNEAGHRLAEALKVYKEELLEVARKAAEAARQSAAACTIKIPGSEHDGGSLDDAGTTASLVHPQGTGAVGESVESPPADTTGFGPAAAAKPRSSPY
jgi:hypothetical protein